MTLALFDLDNTLLAGDSDYSWGIFLGELGILDPDEQAQKQAMFYQQYVDGQLDMDEFLAYQLATLGQHPRDQLEQWRDQFMQQVIEPMLQAGKPDLVEKHRDLGHDLVIITATNDFVTRPIADMLGVEVLIATTAEMVDGEYTGRASGIPCFQDGKVRRLREWMQDQRKSLEASWFYSDSINDLPLLKLCDHPVCVTPDDRLRQYAQQHGWQIID